MAYGTINADLMTTSDGVSSSGLYGFKNRLINSAMVIDQRNAGASVSITASNSFITDRFNFTVIAGSPVMTGQQVADAPANYKYSLKATTTTAASSLTGTNRALIQQNIEGLNIIDLGWGTATASAVTLSFWVKSSLTGTFGGALQNSDSSRSYPFTYSIGTAGTWTQISVIIAGDTSGTWLTTNGIGIQVIFGLGVASGLSGTAGSWSGNDYRSATGAVSVLSTLNATWQVTGVQLEKGSTATSFDYRPYGTELQLCQRYFWRMNGVSGGNATFASAMVWGSTDVRAVLTNPVLMRTTVSVSITGTNYGYANAGSVKTLATINAADQTPQTVLLYSGAGTTSATVGQAAQYVITNVDSYISVSAEL